MRLARSLPGILVLLAMNQGLALAESGKKHRVRVRVRVVEVAGGQAYLEPGGDNGIATGDTVYFGRRRFKVVAVNASSAVIEQANGTPSLGARGSVRVRVKSPKSDAQLPVPVALDAYRGQWLAARRPADDQSTRPVPLGAPGRHGQSRATLSIDGGAIVPLADLGSGFGRGRARAQVQYQPLQDASLAFNADASGRVWMFGDRSRRPGSGARDPLFVRELTASYGQARGWHAALGRLRYASQLVGMLDGARTQAPLSEEITLSAFGGAVPDPIDAAPSLDASRFGGELAWESTELAYEPRVVIGGYGSHFDGSIDERRLHGLVDLAPDFGRLGAHMEWTFLDEDNPWGAPQSQVSGAGVDALVDIGTVEFGGRFDMMRPERSRWLASALPAEWLCAPVGGGPAASGCAGDEIYFGGQLDVRTQTEHTRLTVGANADGGDVGAARRVGGFTHLRLLGLWRTLRLDSSASYSYGSLVRGGRLLLGVGAEFADGVLDVSLHYQPAYLVYEADIGRYVEHETGLSAILLAGADIDVTLAADLIRGRDVDLLLIQSMLTYRPSF